MTKTKIKHTMMVLTTLLSFSNLFASEDLNFTNIETTGSGCPIGSTDIVTSPDGKSISVLFNKMFIELPQFDGVNDNDQSTDYGRRDDRYNKLVANKICNILVEADLPSDYKVEGLEITADFRGSTILEQGGEALFVSQLENFFGPRAMNRRNRDVVAKKEWMQGPVEEDWVISNTKVIPINGNCSRHGDLKTKFNLRNILRAKIDSYLASQDAFAYIGIDSTDFIGKLDIKVNAKSCRSRHSRPSRPSNDRGRRVGQRCHPGEIFYRPLGRCLTSREIREIEGRGRSHKSSRYRRR